MVLHLSDGGDLKIQFLCYVSHAGTGLMDIYIYCINLHAEGGYRDTGTITVELWEIRIT